MPILMLGLLALVIVKVVFPLIIEYIAQLKQFMWLLLEVVLAVIIMFSAGLVAGPVGVIAVPALLSLLLTKEWWGVLLTVVLWIGAILLDILLSANTKLSGLILGGAICIALVHQLRCFGL